jgi:hypothetical protein
MPFGGVEYDPYHLEQTVISFTLVILPDAPNCLDFRLPLCRPDALLLPAFTCIITSNHFRTPTMDTIAAVLW